MRSASCNLETFAAVEDAVVATAPVRVDSMEAYPDDDEGRGGGAERGTEEYGGRTSCRGYGYGGGGREDATAAWVG
jgi:hypothetical protein